MTLTEVAAPIACETGGYIYFMVCESPAGTPIKVGITRDIAKRIKNIRSGNPWPIILVGFYWVRDPDLEEATLHERFHQARVRGEWFDCIPELVAIIVDVRNFAYLHEPDRPEGSL